MMDCVAYARSIRRGLREYPEIGPDLPKTLAFALGRQDQAPAGRKDRLIKCARKLKNNV